MRYIFAFFIFLTCQAEYLPRINAVIDYDEDTRNILGNSTESYINNLVLASKMVFKNELGIDLNIVAKRAISITADNHKGNLEIYKKFISANSIVGINIYHLIQGGNLGVTGLGLSFQNGACSSNYGISTSKLSTFNLTVQTIVHEIAHTIGAKHDDTNINLMNSTNETPSFKINPNTKNEILYFIKNSCLFDKQIKYPNIIWNRNGTVKKINHLPKIHNITYLLQNKSILRSSSSKKINKKSSFIIQIKSGAQIFYLINKIDSSNLINSLSLFK